MDERTEDYLRANGLKPFDRPEAFGVDELGHLEDFIRASKAPPPANTVLLLIEALRGMIVAKRIMEAPSTRPPELTALSTEMASELKTMGRRIDMLELIVLPR